jgi:heptosyltransferase-3
VTSLAKQIRRGLKEPAQSAIAWAAVRGRDVRPRSLEELRALEPRAIVAVRTDRIGDLLVSTPLLVGLHHRWPNARLVVVPGPKNCAVLEGLPFVEAGPVFDRHPVSWAAMTRWALGQRFDLAVSLRAEAMSGVFVAAASGAPVRVTTHATKTASAFNFIFGIDDPHHLRRCSRAAELLGAPGAERPVFVIPDAERRRATEAMDRLLGTAGGARVGVQMPSRGDRRHAAKAWPVDRLHELVAGLAAEGVRVVLFGVGAELEEARRIRAEVPAAEVAPVGSLAFAAGLLTRLDLFVSGFTGTHHLADAVGVPTVAIGTTLQAEHWRSLGAGHGLAVSEQVADVGVAAVLEAVRRGLATRRAGR